MSFANYYDNLQQLPSPNDTLGVLSRISTLYELGTERELKLIMAWTNTVISGSWALLAIFPDSFIPGDLDLYTARPHSTCFALLIPYLKSCGYRVVSFTDANYVSDLDPETSGIDFVFKLSNQTSSINIIMSHTQSEIQPVFRFHSTVVMNYIAWYGVVCLYPGLTLERRGLVNHHVLSSRVNACIAKYRSRGFDLQTSLTHWENVREHVCGINPNCPTSHRTLHSPSVLFVPFRPGYSIADFIGDIDWLLRIICIA